MRAQRNLRWMPFLWIHVVEADKPPNEAVDAAGFDGQFDGENHDEQLWFYISDSIFRDISNVYTNINII